MGEAGGYLVALKRNLEAAVWPRADGKGRARAIPAPKRIDERPYALFSEELEQAHAEVREIVGELASQMHRLTDALCGEIERRAKMKHLISDALSCMSLNGIITDRMYGGIRGA